MQKLPPILHLKKLSVKREVKILDRIDWRIEAGQHWVLLGPNGSGKTSLLAALTAYLSPSNGEIELLGQRYGQSDWRDLRKQIGLVSSSVAQMIRDDETALYAVLSGKEAMINFWGKSSERDLKAAKKILKELKIAALAERPWAYLSLGERQRVLIGRAMMAQAKLLILDEPCAGLDLVARESFLNFLQDFAAKKTAPTLILVTHHIEEIMPIFSHVLLLKKTRVLASGLKSKVINSAQLSKLFEVPLVVKKSRGRFRVDFRKAAR